MIDGDRVLKLTDKVSFQNLGSGQGAVVLTIATGQLHTCNDTTAAFLMALDGQRDFASIVDVLHDQYDATKDVLREDLARLAGSLLEAGVIA